MLEATTILVRTEAVNCPHCGERQDGWVNDPRGTETKCDDCGKDFKIAANAEIKICR